jgi:twinkle protein
MRMGELTLWTGYAGHGKTTALNQAVSSAAGQGAKVGMLSLEFAIPALIQAMRWQSFGFSQAPSTRLWKDEWREWVDGRLWFYDHHGMQEGARIAAAVWHMVANLGVDVVVVDSLMMCGVQSDGQGFGTAQTEFVNRLINVCRRHPCHIHLVAHARKDKDDTRPAGLLDVSGHANLVNLPHNIISFWRNKAERVKRDQDGLMCVLKDRFGGYDGAVPLWWHETSRQYLDSMHGTPERYCA